MTSYRDLWEEHSGRGKSNCKALRPWEKSTAKRVLVETESPRGREELAHHACELLEVGLVVPAGDASLGVLRVEMILTPRKEKRVDGGEKRFQAEP